MTPKGVGRGWRWGSNSHPVPWVRSPPAAAQKLNFLVFGGVILVVYGLISFIKTAKSFRNIVRDYQSVKIKKGYWKLFVKGFLLSSPFLKILFYFYSIFISISLLSKNPVFISSPGGQGSIP